MLPKSVGGVLLLLVCASVLWNRSNVVWRDFSELKSLLPLASSVIGPAIEVVRAQIPGAQASGGAERKLLVDVESQSIRLRMLHKHHVHSPVHSQHKHANPGDSFRDRVEMDRHRMKHLKKQMQAKLMHQLAEVENNQPGSGGSTYKFESRMVSGSTLGSGQYFVDFYIGTPPQKFSLIVDTGSDLIWVQCLPCIFCNTPSGPVFSPNSSSTDQPLTCDSSECQYISAPVNFTCNTRHPGVCLYAYGYADQSITQGVFSTETVTMNVSNGQNVRVDNVAFGCGNLNMGPSLTGAGGVIGLGQGPISFTSQIGYIFGNTFSYCLVDYLDAPTMSSSLIFASEGAFSSKVGMQFTPFVKNPFDKTSYYVGIEAVSVAGTQLNIPSQVWQVNELGEGGTIVDSGTTLTVLLEPAYVIVLNAFRQAICYPPVPSMQGLDFCFHAPESAIASLPELVIRLYGGAVFRPPTSNYFVQTSKDTVCLAMMGSNPPFGYNILGNLLQQNFEIVYDRAGQRLGFAPAKCSSL